MQAGGGAGERGAALLRHLLEADALQGVADALRRMLQDARGAPALPSAASSPPDPASPGTQADGPGGCGRAERLQPRSAQACGLRAGPPAASSAPGGQAAAERPGLQGTPGAPRPPSAPGSPRAPSAASAPGPYGPGAAPAAASARPDGDAGAGLRWHLAVDAAWGHGELSPADAADAAVLSCVIAPAAAGLALAESDLEQELLGGALAPQVRAAAARCLWWPLPVVAGREPEPALLGALLLSCASMAAASLEPWRASAARHARHQPLAMEQQSST